MVRLRLRFLRKGVEIEGRLNGLHLFVRKRDQSLFPPSRIHFILVTNIGEIETRAINKGGGLHIYKMSDWVYWNRRNSNLKRGDKVKLSVIEPLKRYRLETSK